MTDALIFIIILIVGEIIAFFIFKFINFSLENIWELKINRSVLKGVLERLFLFLALVYYIPQALIAFGAIKIGTRFIKEEDNKISNDYFYIGNMTSLLIALLYFIIWKIIIK